MDIKRGAEFTHAHFMNCEREPLLCRVTRVAQGVVYYRPVYGKHDDGTDWLGSPAYIGVEDFQDIARET